MSESLPKEKILGVSVTSASLPQVLEFITKSLEKGKEKVKIFTPNPEIIVAASNNSHYKTLLNSAEVALPDGVGVVMASRMLGKSIHNRITGVDFVESLCEKLSKRIETVGFLGGGVGVAEKAAQCLKDKYPGLNVAFALQEWPTQESPRLQSKVKNYYKYSSTFPKADVLFVAFGAPKQEQWIAENLPHIPVTVAMGVGGTFDYLAGEVSRAPSWMRSVGLEWLYRLIRQPWRWKRQLALLHFIVLVGRASFSRD